MKVILWILCNCRIVKLYLYWQLGGFVFVSVDMCCIGDEFVSVGRMLVIAWAISCICYFVLYSGFVMNLVDPSWSSTSRLNRFVVLLAPPCR